MATSSSPPSSSRNGSWHATKASPPTTSTRNTTRWFPQSNGRLIKERIAKQAEVKIEKEDLENFAKAIAAQQLAQYGMYNLGDDVLADYAKRILEDKNSRSHIIEQVGDRKLFDAIKNLANVDVKEVTLDEFKEIAQKAQA